MGRESGLVPLRESVLLDITGAIRPGNGPFCSAFHDKSVMGSFGLATCRCAQASGFKGSFNQGGIFKRGSNVQTGAAAGGFLLAKWGESDNSPDNFRIYTKIS